MKKHANWNWDDGTPEDGPAIRPAATADEADLILAGRWIGNKLHGITSAGSKFDLTENGHTYHFYSHEHSTEFTIDDSPIIHDICEFNERSEL